MHITANRLNFEVQKPTQIGNLSIFPLTSKLQSKKGEKYLFLDDALNQKLADVSEVSEKPELDFFRKLKVVNKSSQGLLILGGEQIIGHQLRQNRIVSYSVLIPANSSAIVKVNCGEKKRWSPHVNNEISISKFLYFSRANLDRQFKIWSDISRKLKDYQIKTFTQSIQEIYKKTEANNDRAINFQPGIYDIGLAIGSNNKIRSVDFFESPYILKKYFKKIIRSASLNNGFVKSKYKSHLKEQDVHNFLEESSKRIYKSEEETLGSRIEFYGQSINGSALLNENNIVHCSIFMEDKVVKDPERLYDAA
jgi:hypothetical protein|tara:strand:- start:1864 stop:2787 length:924 start_codon:yes stop_codon:yes gene_type:complete